MWISVHATILILLGLWIIAYFFCLLLLYINQCLVFLLTLWSFAHFGPSFFLTLFSRIMPMIEMSWHTIYVNMLRWDCEPCDMHKSRSCASYLAHRSIVAYSCVQRPMYIYIRHSFWFTLVFFENMPMIEMSWHNIYVNVLRWDCTPCAMHKSRCYASYLAYGSIVAYSCVQQPSYIRGMIFELL